LQNSIDQRTDRAPKTLIVFWGTGGAGVRYTYRVSRELAAGLGEANLQVSLSHNNGWIRQTQGLGVGIHLVHANESHRDILISLLKLPLMAARFARLCWQTRPDVLVIPMNFAYASAVAIIAVLMRIKLIYVIHDAMPHPGDYAQTYQRISQWLLVRCASRLVTPSSVVAENALADLPDKLQTMFDVSPLHTMTERRAVEPRALGPGPVRFLFMGRLLRYKGLHLLAQALDRLSSRDDWRLTIAGNGSERDFVEKTFSRYPQVDLSHVRWLEEHEVDQVLAASDVVICPYIEASQSGVVPEAQSLAIPAVVTPVGALVEQIAHGAAGWVARSVAGDAIASAMISVLDQRGDYPAKSMMALEMTSERAGSSNWVEILMRTVGRTTVAR
jgi:glycosyltransferase involved in cell wall biosynthesis